jgi:2-polyprenyl-6-hydroxyphenyl methylase/3-demethylubiquinone-9 3-methyltransferase
MRAFDFGANWRAFSAQRVDTQRLAVAHQSILNLLQTEQLQNVRFLDVGCGSGLFSIAAYQSGAEKVTGIDINPKCVTVSEQNHNNLVTGADITFRQASALDPEQMRSLGQFDIVYAWGSLHHTGAMWDAIQNTAQCVAPGGTLVLAIYNRHITSPVWKMIKWFYNQVPGFLQSLMAIFFAAIIYVAKFLVTRRNPLEKERGMDFWYDVIDWIGGYPYEYATSQEVEDFLQKQGFRLQRLVPAQVPTGCNEFVFAKCVS